MDGGVAGSGTHCDLVAGADKALVLSLFGGRAQATSTQPPGTLHTELERLQRSGTTVEARHTGLPEDVNLMDPAAMSQAVADARTQAEADADTMGQLFGG
jgi:hypothetical protein